jgi:hypothetical protein
VVQTRRGMSSLEKMGCRTIRKSELQKAHPHEYRNNELRSVTTMLLERVSELRG